MAVLEPRNPRPVPFGAITTHRAVSAVDRALRGVQDWLAARSTARELATMSDAELADIGLHRGSIESSLRRRPR